MTETHTVYTDLNMPINTICHKEFQTRHHITSVSKALGSEGQNEFQICHLITSVSKALGSEGDSVTKMRGGTNLNFHNVFYRL